MAFVDFCRQPFLYAFIYHEVVVYVLISKVFIYSQKCSLTLVRQKLVLSAYGEWVELLSPHNRRTKHRIYFNVLMKFSYIFIYTIFSFSLCSPVSCHPPSLLSSSTIPDCELNFAIIVMQLILLSCTCTAKSQQSSRGRIQVDRVTYKERRGSLHARWIDGLVGQVDWRTVSRTPRPLDELRSAFI